MNRIFTLLPEADTEEALFLESFLKDVSDEQLQNFILVYRGRRKDPQTLLIMSVVGLFFLPGLQRFMVNQIGMGILYLFTIGLCFIGSIVDLVNYKNMAFEYNQQVAREIRVLI
ncbi:TM2 domain-containing protein [Carboxylicivirga sp. N1Y90]|uniref:TM2 domain-containing protein n=1 Tax=Carboxylicivirga fragile TaxID=3417571 RepID=UPI003D355BCD|nr:TM2 domain-containing protein [Marinilabiliaceae bacterium N1Y90]